MARFALKEIEAATGRIKFYKLVSFRMREQLDKEGILLSKQQAVEEPLCEFDDFEATLRAEGNMVTEIERIYALISHVSDGVAFPEKQFKILKGANNLVKNLKPFEIKTKSLRVYGYFSGNPPGRIIILGGKKNNQPKDIERLFSILKRLGNEPNPLKIFTES